MKIFSTQGPWHVQEEYDTLWIWSENKARIIAIKFQEPKLNQFEKELNRANASLIAAAPELLEALELGLKEISAAYQQLGINNPERGKGTGGVISKIESALRKATGEKESAS